MDHLVENLVLDTNQDILDEVPLITTHYSQEDIVAPCRVNSSFHSAKELLLLALNKEDQHSWVQRLSKRITRQGIAKQGPSAGEIWKYCSQNF